MTDAVALFTPWESFYVIVGSSGAALTGLQFVVMALIAEADRKGSSDAVDAFGSPTIVHFCMVLLTASVISAPWHRPIFPAAILAAVGLGGIGYAAIVIARTRRQKDYKPVFEDWLWHAALPVIGYATMLGGAIAIGSERAGGLFATGGTCLLLLFVGIHNAWDSVAYVATRQFRKDPPAAN